MHRVLLLVGIVWCLCSASFAQSPRKDVSSKPAQKVIIDTDIGDDIDDAFAIALAVKSPEIEILGVTTTFGDTEARARIAGRLLTEVGRTDIPVVAGVPTKTDNVMTQRRYGEGGRFVAGQPGGAVEFILQEIRKYPGEITLVGIGPLMNVAAVIDKDLETFRKLKRVVIMGGSIDCGYGELWFCPQHGPDAEWNIARDVAAAQKLFTSGVPLYVMPLDSTQLRFVETMRAYVFRQGTPMTDALTLLYHQWGQSTPDTLRSRYDRIPGRSKHLPGCANAHPRGRSRLHTQRSRRKERASLHEIQRAGIFPFTDRSNLSKAIVATAEDFSPISRPHF